MHKPELSDLKYYWFQKFLKGSILLGYLWVSDKAYQSGKKKKWQLRRQADESNGSNSPGKARGYQLK